MGHLNINIKHPKWKTCCITSTAIIGNKYSIILLISRAHISEFNVWINYTNITRILVLLSTFILTLIRRYEYIIKNLRILGVTFLSIVTS